MRMHCTLTEHLAGSGVAIEAKNQVAKRLYKPLDISQLCHVSLSILGLPNEQCSCGLDWRPKTSIWTLGESHQKYSLQMLQQDWIGKATFHCLLLPAAINFALPAFAKQSLMKLGSIPFKERKNCLAQETTLECELLCIRNRTMPHIILEFC
jgi:hypothetical protein